MGRRHEMDSIGSSYEGLAAQVVGRLATMIKVPDKKDFGIDFYCEPRFPAGHKCETVAEMCALQVKGGKQQLSLGGHNKRGEWKVFEFSRLRSLATPLFLTRVDRGFTAVDLFSLSPLWWIFWKTGVPFKVVFQTEPPGNSPGWQEPQPSDHPKGIDYGDGKEWNVKLGPPFLRLTNTDLNDPAFHDLAVNILRTWITTDRLTMIRFLQGVPVVDFISHWTTNSTEGYRWATHQFWNKIPGANIQTLCQTAAPVLANLGVHLQWQNDEAVYRFVPVLEWLNQLGFLDEFGRALLNALRPRWFFHPMT